MHWPSNKNIIQLLDLNGLWIWVSSLMLQFYSITYYSITHICLPIFYSFLITHRTPSSDYSFLLTHTYCGWLILTADDWSMNLIITKTDCTYCALHIIAYSYLSSLLITLWLVDKTSPIMYINPRYKLYFFSFILGFSILC